MASPLSTGVWIAAGSNSAATISNLRASLANAQAALDEANNEIGRLCKENSSLKAAARPAPGPKKNQRIIVSTPIDYKNDLLNVANQFTLLDFVWVKGSAFQSPCPPNPIPIETRYSDEINMLLHMRFRLYECIPEKYHCYLQDIAEFGINFNRYSQQQRSNLISKLRSAVHNIFGLAYPQITVDLWNSPIDRGSSPICRQLYMSEDSGHQRFDPLLAPIIYARSNVNVEGIFQNEVLFLIGICSLFGHTAIRGKIPKNSLGVKWGIKSVTSGLIAFCCVASIFLVSNDVNFEDTGAKSGINYNAAFLAYKQRIEMYQETARFQKIIKLWNTRLFRESNADAEEFDFSNINSRAAEIDAALSGNPVPSSPSSSALGSFTHDMLSSISAPPPDVRPLSSASTNRQARANIPIAPTITNASQGLNTSQRTAIFTLPAPAPRSTSLLDVEQGTSSDESADTIDNENPDLLAVTISTQQHSDPIPTLTISTPSVTPRPMTTAASIPPANDETQKSTLEPANTTGTRGRPKARGKKPANVAGARRSARNQQG